MFVILGAVANLLDVKIASALSGVTSIMEGRGGGAAAPGGGTI
jgi:hypothetical protein